MAREDPQLKLRLTEEMKAKVTEAAKASGRSVNAEIVARLEASFDAKETKSARDIIADIQAALHAMQDDLARQRAYMYGLVEEAVTGTMTPEQARMLRPLFPKRRAVISRLFKEYKDAVETGQSDLATEKRRQLEDEYEIRFGSPNEG